MRKYNVFLLLLSGITCVLAFSSIALSSGPCDAAIEITGDASCQTEAVSEPKSILEVLPTMRGRFVHYYADSRNTILVGDMNPDLRSQIDNTSARLIMYRVDSLTSLPLAFPKEMVNDQAAPEFDRSPSSKLNGDGTFTIAWTANEFVNGTLRYGTQAGAYTSDVSQPNYGMRNEVTTVEELVSGELYYGQIEMVDLSGNSSKSLEFTFGAKSGKPLVLIYAGLDNNLGDEIDNLNRLIHNIESGAHAGISTRLFLDEPKQDGTYIFDVIPDKVGSINPLDPSCSGAYTEGTNCWKQADEDSAHPFALYSFIKDAIEAHRVENGNETQILLSLVGHGSGWSANVLPGQPSGWTDQPSGWTDQPNGQVFTERLGGLLWDDNPGNGDQTSRSMSTKGLGQALKWVQNETGRTIDLIYFDACSMGMAEVAYEIRDAASYMLASPNTAWSSFGYAGMLAEVSGTKTTVEIAEGWMAAEASLLSKDFYPFTLALYDLGEMDELAEAADQLATDLIRLMTTYKNEMRQAHSETEHYESNYDGAIERNKDNYGDFGSFGAGVRNKVPGGDAFRKLVGNMQNQVKDVIESSQFQNGNPWNYPTSAWQWTDQADGMGIYLPLEVDEPKRQLYTAANLAWAADTQWDEFLASYWGPIVRAANDELLPICGSTRGCTTLDQIGTEIKVDPDDPTFVIVTEGQSTPVPSTSTPVPSTPTPVPSTSTPIPSTPVPDSGEVLYLPLINN